MADRAKPNLGARLAIGGIAGIVATLALTSTARRLQGKAPARADGLLTLLAPFAYGAAAGALLAAASPRPGRLIGALAGGGLWLGGEAGLLPRVSIGPARERSAGRSIALLAGHLAWGWSAAEAMRQIGDVAGD
jgi:hypothetical protein